MPCADEEDLAEALKHKRIFPLPHINTEPIEGDKKPSNVFREDVRT